jgi:hypothetical protein
MTVKFQYKQPLSKTIINQYKRHDIFKCVHQSHVNFEHRVSVYHVLKAKKCYPEGCIYFNWRCRRLNKGKPCSKKFKHVGKNCFNCKEFYDEKEILQPELLLSDVEYQKFIRNFNLFEDWLEELRGNEIDFSGTINSLKPSFYKNDNHRNSQLSFDGFLINFKEGYINLDHFNDLVYAKISSRMQHRYNFCKGDKVNFYARFNEKDGRIILSRLNRIDIDEKADNETWTESKAHLAKKTGTIIPVQYEKCLNCDKGSLLDIISDSKRQRMLFCLEGIRDPHFCSYTISKLLLADSCSKVEKEKVYEDADTRR